LYGSPLLAGCWRSVTSTVACCTLLSAGGPAFGENSQSSASWSKGSPLFAVMFKRKYWYAWLLVNEYCLVWNRWGKVSPVRASRSVQFVPSVDPCSVQSLGSRPWESLADVSA
jgi:hypothetical protein